MKINKWTLGLLALGLVTVASVKAEEATETVQTALSSTVISGYVDVSAQWNPGTGTAAPASSFMGGKRDGFNVNSVSLTLSKPVDEGEWSAGYTVDFLLGPDGPAVTGGGPIRQAYVALRAPVGNGIDIKVGRWDTILGYESTDSYKNPNFTRSYGYSLTPTEHDGVLLSYQFTDFLNANLGVANTAGTGAINARAGFESRKAYMGSLGFVAPENWGSLAGSTLTIGAIDGFGGVNDFTDYYIGATIMTPIEGLKFGADYNLFDDVFGKGTDTYTTAGYVSFKATEKLGLHFRGEYGHGIALNPVLGSTAPVANTEVLAATATIQYDIWENVISRLELRWDHDADGSAVSPFAANKRNDYAIIANLVYKF